MTEHPGQPPTGRPWPPPAWPAPGHPPPQWAPDQTTPAGYGAPGHGQGYPPPQGFPPPHAGTDGFAIATLVLGIIAVVPLAVIFGILALGRTGPGRQAGRGMAIAGLALAGVWTLLIGAGIAVAVATAAEGDDSGQIASGGSVAATDLQEGDCLNGLGDDVTSVQTLPAVPCAVAHEGEVFAVFDLPAGPYPGATAVDEQVEAGCYDRFDTYAPRASADTSIGIFFVYPLEANWRLGDREVVCIATTPSPTTGSLRDR